MSVVTPLTADPIPGAALEIVACVGDAESLDTLARVMPGSKSAADLRLGSVETCLEVLARGVRPSMILVDVAGRDHPAQDLAQLRAAAPADATILCLGDSNDIGLYRALLGAGATDYLLKPLRAAELRRTLLTAVASAEDQAPKPGARVAVFVGVRGGVGATTVATAAATQAAGWGQKQTALIDLDVHFGTAALALEMEPSKGLRDALEHADRIDGLFVASALSVHSERLSVLGAEEDPKHPLAASEESLKRLGEELRTILDQVVYDLPRHLIPLAAPVLSTADAVYLVTDLSVAGMRDTLRVKETLVDWAPDVPVRVIANRAGLNRAGELPQAEFERCVGAPVAFKLAEDKALCRQVMQGKPVDQLAPKGRFGAALRPLCQDMIGQAPAPKGWFAGLRKSKAA